MFYSAKNKGFFKTNQTDDCVEITQDQYNDLMKNQEMGLEIVSDDDGFPICVEKKINDKDLIVLKINQLESKITNRRLRDAILTQDGDVWLANAESEIAQLRAQL